MKVTVELFEQIKAELEYVDVVTTAAQNGLSEKTILQIKGSETYADYEAQKRAQHPPVKYSMRDMLEQINAKLDTLLRETRQGKLL